MALSRRICASCGASFQPERKERVVCSPACAAARRSAGFRSPELLRGRFEANVHTEPMTGCHLWGGQCDRSGYGRFCAFRKHVAAHRFSWWLYRGEDPGALSVLHACDTPACVNPEHLRLGTQADNARDMALKGRGRSGPLPYGVERNGRRFSAYSMIGGRKRYLGMFDDPAAASAAAHRARREAYACR